MIELAIKNKNFDFEKLNDFMNSIYFVLTDIHCTGYGVYIDKLTYSNINGVEIGIDTNIDTNYIISKLKGSVKNDR